MQEGGFHGLGQWLCMRPWWSSTAPLRMLDSPLDLAEEDRPRTLRSRLTVFEGLQPSQVVPIHGKPGRGGPEAISS